jgi:hypothetical protein
MKKTLTSRPLPVGLRQTRPSYFDGFASGRVSVNGGVGIIARRGWDPSTAAFIEQLAQGKTPEFTRRWAETMPLRMLRILVETHEMAGNALSNDLSFTFRPGSMKVVAVKDYRGGKGTIDDSETAYIQRLWNRTQGLKTDEMIPGGSGGGMEELQKTLARQQTTDGMSALECVIGDDGVSDIIDFDPLSIRFKDTDEGRIAEQSQFGIEGGAKPLDLTTIRLSAWGGSRENPYGSPRFGRFLPLGLSDTAEQRSLRDWLYAMAWPRIAFEFPIEQWVEYATQNKEVLIGQGPEDENGVRGDLTATQWAEQQVIFMKGVCESLTSSDFIVMATGGRASALNISPGTGVAELLTQRRLRVCQSLDHPPALLGITDGGTQAYATVQLRGYGNKLTAVASDPDRAVEWIVNLDLRARGVDMVARIEREPIILTDKLIDEQARQLEISNTMALVDRGVMSPEEASVALTGSGMFDAKRAYNQTAPAPVPVKGNQQ